MAKYFYHPLGDNAVPPANSNDRQQYAPHTYSGHGDGKLDLSADNTPVYSMTDGTVERCGQDNSGSYHSVGIKTQIDGVDGYVYFRYYHIFPKEGLKVGDTVKQGELLGQTGNDLGAGATGDHLHIDLSYGLDFRPVYMTEQQYEKLPNYVDKNIIEEWSKISGDNGKTKLALNYAIFAQKLTALSSDTTVDTSGLRGKQITKAYKSIEVTASIEDEDNPIEVQLFNLFKSKGYSVASICGILGNLAQETGTALRYYAELGEYKNNSGGIMMWHPYSNHVNWCNANGYAGKDKTVEANVAHCVAELEQKGASDSAWQKAFKASPSLQSQGFTPVANLAEFKKISDPELAAVVFERNFEISGDWNLISSEKTNYTPDMKYDRKRRLFALGYYDIFTGKV